MRYCFISICCYLTIYQAKIKKLKKFFRTVIDFADFFVENEIRKLDIISHLYKIRKKKILDGNLLSSSHNNSYLKISTYTV